MLDYITLWELTICAKVKRNAHTERFIELVKKEFIIYLSTFPKENKAKQIFQYGNKTIEYTLMQSKRRNMIEVMVDKDEITIRSPFDKSLEEIEKILWQNKMGLKSKRTFEWKTWSLNLILMMILHYLSWEGTTNLKLTITKGTRRGLNFKIINLYHISILRTTKENQMKRCYHFKTIGRI